MYVPELLFVTGAHKTGTSTLLGMLNCSKEIYLEFELFGHKGYTQKFLAHQPKAREMFEQAETRLGFYEEFAPYTMRMNKVGAAAYVGEKFPTLRFEPIHELRENLIIYTVRDIRTWLAKETSLAEVYPEHEWPNMAIEYVRTFIKMFTIGPDNCYMIRMEDIIGRNDVVIGRLSKFLDIPSLKVDLRHWWTNIGAWSYKNPKSYSMWWSGHRSSKVPPVNKKDVIVELNPHPFWSVVLPIFDKYYENLNARFDVAEINGDLAKLESLKKYSDLNIRDLYSGVKTQDIVHRKRRR